MIGLYVRGNTCNSCQQHRQDPKWLLTPIALASTLVFNPVAMAATLDEQVTALLKFEGTQPCALLFAEGGNPSGDLGGICTRTYSGGTGPVAVPNNATSSGGSTTPVTTLKSQYTKTDERTDAQQIAPRWSIFATVESGDLDRSTTETEGAYDSSTAKLLAGFTYAYSDSATLSLAFNHYKQDGDYSVGGDFDYVANGLLGIVTFDFTPFSLDLLVAYDRYSADRDRQAQLVDEFDFIDPIVAVNAAPNAEFDYDQFSTSIQGNFGDHIGSFFWQTQFALDMVYADYGTYSETQGEGLQLTFHDDSKTSIQSRAGVLGSYAISTSAGVILPQLSLSWLHEFRTDGRDITVSFAEDLSSVSFDYQTDDEEADYLVAGIAAVYVFKGGSQGFIQYQTLLEHSYLDSNVFSAGFRQEF